MAVAGAGGRVGGGGWGGFDRSAVQGASWDPVAAGRVRGDGGGGAGGRARGRVLLGRVGPVPGPRVAEGWVVAGPVEEDHVTAGRVGGHGDLGAGRRAGGRGALRPTQRRVSG